MDEQNLDTPTQVTKPSKNKQHEKNVPKKMSHFSLEDMTDKKMALHDYLDLIEFIILTDAFAICNGNMTHAAKMLGVHRTTFIMKIRKMKYMQNKLGTETNG